MNKAWVVERQLRNGAWSPESIHSGRYAEKTAQSERDARYRFTYYKYRIRRWVREEGK